MNTFALSKYSSVFSGLRNNDPAQLFRGMYLSPEWIGIIPRDIWIPILELDKYIPMYDPIHTLGYSGHTCWEVGVDGGAGIDGSAGGDGGPVGDGGDGSAFIGDGRELCGWRGGE